MEKEESQNVENISNMRSIVELKLLNELDTIVGFKLHKKLFKTENINNVHVYV